VDPFQPLDGTRLGQNLHEALEQAARRQSLMNRRQALRALRMVRAVAVLEAGGVMDEADLRVVSPGRAGIGDPGWGRFHLCLSTDRVRF
jgi:hypothetical protein